MRVCWGPLPAARCAGRRHGAALGGRSGRPAVARRGVQPAAAAAGRWRGRGRRRRRAAAAAPAHGRRKAARLGERGARRRVRRALAARGGVVRGAGHQPQPADGRQHHQAAREVRRASVRAQERGDGGAATAKAPVRPSAQPAPGRRTARGKSRGEQPRAAGARGRRSGGRARRASARRAPGRRPLLSQTGAGAPQQQADTPSRQGEERKA